MTDPDRPTHPVAGIDHVFLLVHDLAASRDTYARLGFTVSPRGLHSAHKGAANHTIMFPHDYLELLGMIAETEGNRSRRELLANDGEGLHAVACRITDAAAAKTALAAHGIATGEVGSFSRPVPLPAGGEVQASFNTLMFDPVEVPQGTCFMCQHLTRDAVWVPELLEHPNGAVGLRQVIAMADDPARIAAGYARLFAQAAVRPVDGGCVVETGAQSADLLVLSRAALAARFPDFDPAATPRGAFAALQLQVRDLARTRAVLEGAGFVVSSTVEGVAVAPQDACGTMLEFVPA